ncbi:MAG: imidazole glycerol phosphate synthase subunit HisH [Pseudobacter sp.]|uniref:imidazole glycerol phosphate synthase subunit HisH n=1 Tax=Pseudobacter sp. TaxID=2045420 RepID=UPI003F7DB0F6
MIAILDYGIGNITSIGNMLKKIGVKATITSDPTLIEACEKLILPGVGHFDYCMKQIRNAPFFDTLQHKVLRQQTPVLGVCVGVQMLMEKSEEGKEPGLGWIAGEVVRFRQPEIKGLKVPHMAWTDIVPAEGEKLYADIIEPRFYFVHSYHVLCSPEYVTATADYGYPFTASVKKDNIMGVQFHPEKSHKFGMKLYSNFANHY